MKRSSVMALRSPGKQAPESIRQYSMAWLGRAASRVYERGAELQAERMLLQHRQGVESLFDLSDIQTARWAAQV